MVPKYFDWQSVVGVRDSKKLTPLQREEWYEKIATLKKHGLLDFAVSFSAARSIDRRGIVASIHAALLRCLQSLDAEPDDTEIRLDGSLFAPREFTMQKTIIHGDDLEPIISMASIVAKVRRDRLMRRIARQFPKYDFDMHKGYGTSRHRELIRIHGLCAIHRATFCSRLSFTPWKE